MVATRRPPMVTVVVAEKPSVAEDLAKALGAATKRSGWWESADLRITWAVGHLLELAEPQEYDEGLKRWRMRDLPILPERFQTRPIGARGSDQQLSTITKLLQDAAVDEVVNACDAAREGELIFHRIWEHAAPSAKVTRLWLSALTETAITQAWAERAPASEFAALRDAAVSRAEADWLIGMNGTRAATIRLPKQKRDRRPFSVGRVQTATLAMLTDRELEILAHVPVPFWELNVDMMAEGQTWPARWTRQEADQSALEAEAEASGRKPATRTQILEAAETERLVALLAAGPQAATTERVRDKVRTAPLPFDLTTLQKEANRRWRWSASRTLDVAQSLYEAHKLTTYPRTGSQHLPPALKEEVRATVEKLGGISEYADFSATLVKDGLRNVDRVFSETKVTDHFAIIPTGRLPDRGLQANASKLFDLIARRFLAAFHPGATERELARETAVSDDRFVARRTELIVPGWRALFPPSEQRSEPWIPLSGGTLEMVEDGTSSQHETALGEITWKEDLTKPMGRLTEASLLAMMENAGKEVDDEALAAAMRERGLGTPATRADTIETLLSRGYIERLRSGGFRAAPRGILLIDTLSRAGVDWLTSAELTGEMEHRLRKVEHGELDRATYMSELIARTQGLIERMDAYQAAALHQDLPPIGVCPYSGEDVIETMLNYEVPREKREGHERTLTIWKDTAGRYIDRLHATQLLEHQRVEDLHGFVDQQGREYSASLVVTGEGRVRLESTGTGAADDIPDDGTMTEVTTCPICEMGTVQMTAHEFACDNSSCSLRPVARVLNGRTLKLDEMRPYYTEGCTAELSGFISRYKRPFSATLVRKEDGGLDREFPPRAPRGDGAAAEEDMPTFEVVEGVVATCPEHGAEIIETPTHYEARPGDRTCRLRLLRRISGRDISRADAATLIEARELGPLEDWISKKGDPFTATVYLTKTERHRFRFPKR